MRGWLERRRLRRRAWELADGMPVGPDLIEDPQHPEAISAWLFETVDLGFWFATRGFWGRSSSSLREREAFLREVDDLIARCPEEIDEPSLLPVLAELRAVIVRYDESLR